MDNNWWVDDWVPRIDEDFVYKDRKKPRIDDASTSKPLLKRRLSVEERLQKERRRKTLLKIREMYQKELRQWDNLSNGVLILEANAERQQQFRSPPSPKPPDMPQRSLCSFLDELIEQADLHSKVISDVSDLCDSVEAMCDTQVGKHDFVDLPMWCSPRHLLKSLQ